MRTRPIALHSRDLRCDDGLRDWMDAAQVSIAVAANGHLFLESVRQPVAGTTEVTLDDVAAVTGAGDELWTLDRWQLWRFTDVTESGEAEGGGDGVADGAVARDGAAPRRGAPRILLPQSGHTIGLVQASDLVCTPEGPLVASLLFSCLLAPDDHYSFRPLWAPPWLSALVPESRTGLTGVAVRSGRPDVVTVAGQTDERNGWTSNLGGGLALRTTGEELAGGLRFPRHPRWWGEALLLLEAGTGRVLALNADGTRETVTTVPGVAGGLALHGDHALVGYSAAARCGIEGLEGGPPARGGAPRDGLCLVDLRRGTVTGHATFEGHAGPVQSVAVLTAPTVTIAPPRGLISQSNVVMAPVEPLLGLT